MFSESDYERASQLAEREIEAALDRHREQTAARGAGRETCLDCDEPIPAARRLAVAALRCMDCQAEHEKWEKQTGAR